MYFLSQISVVHHSIHMKKSAIIHAFFKFLALFLAQVIVSSILKGISEISEGTDSNIYSTSIQLK